MSEACLVHNGALLKCKNIGVKGLDPKFREETKITLTSDLTHGIPGASLRVTPELVRSDTEELYWITQSKYSVAEAFRALSTMK